MHASGRRAHNENDLSGYNHHQANVARIATEKNPGKLLDMNSCHERRGDEDELGNNFTLNATSASSSLDQSIWLRISKSKHLLDRKPRSINRNCFD